MFIAVNRLGCFYLFSVFGGEKKKAIFHLLCICSVASGGAQAKQVLSSSSFILFPKASQLLTFLHLVLTICFCCITTDFSNISISPAHPPRQVIPSLSAPSPPNQARMRTAVCQVWIDTLLVDLSAWPLLGLSQIFVSVKAPENGNCAITVMADTDRSLAWVKSWLASHYRNDSSCEIIQFHCKVKYFVQNLVQGEVRHIFYDANSLQCQPKSWQQHGSGGKN